MISYLLAAIVSAIGFLLGRFLLPFALYNKFAGKIMQKVVKRRAMKDGMPTEYHLLRFVRDVDSAGGGMFSALAIRLLNFVHPQSENIVVWNVFIGGFITTLLAVRKCTLNMGTTRNWSIAIFCYLSVIFLTDTRMTLANHILSILCLIVFFFVIAKGFPRDKAL